MRLMSMGEQRDAAAVNPVMTGFAQGTAIRTENGARAVETLRKGDTVITRYGKPVSVEDVVATPFVGSAIRINKNALSPGTPRRDLIVASDQLIMLTAPVLEWLFDCNAALVPAKHLTELDGVNAVQLTEPMEMIRLTLDAPRIVFGSGLALATSAMAPGHPIRALDDSDVVLLKNHIDDLIVAA